MATKLYTFFFVFVVDVFEYLAKLFEYTFSISVRDFLNMADFGDNWFADLYSEFVSFVVNILHLGDVSLFAFLFGSSLITAYVLVQFLNWCLSLIRG